MLATEAQNLDGLSGVECDKLRIVSRRFPSRLRSSRLAALARYTMPRSDIEHGLFSYVFPSAARGKVITLHDVSVLIDGFHPREGLSGRRTMLADTIRRATRIVCSSESTRSEVHRYFPDCVSKTARVYCGVDDVASASSSELTWDVLPPAENNKDVILTVGTVEPRKNYETVLDAYEELLRVQDRANTILVVVGAEGWECGRTVARLRSLEGAGKVLWRRSVTDQELAAWYHRSSLFTYLSLYEGFGYPPFEAALANVPMVLSNRSSVGELWSGRALCVDPTDSVSIVSAWQKVLAGPAAFRQHLVHAQRKWAGQFTWERSVGEYVDQYLVACTDNHIHCRGVDELSKPRWVRAES